MALKVVLALLVLVQSVAAREVVVFVHGLAGFGPDELGPIQYWAYRTKFPSSYYRTYEASVGPISSNWDRACELYAQIKGTRVDYGKAHSDKYGHARYGRDYTGKGFFPEWNSANRVHLVGHSMGGMTIRMLEFLLQEGDDAEKSATGSGTSDLFKRKGNWIKTITTFSTPHDGTPLIDTFDNLQLLDLIQGLVLGFSSVSQLTFVTSLYDFDLDHWGLELRNGESFGDYWNRITSSSVFDIGNEDFAPFDLSPAGARKLNNRGQQAYSGTYYFGYATEQTYPFWNILRWTWVQLAEFDMWIFLQPFANIIGGANTPSESRANDGLVPWESSKCPKKGNGYSSSSSGSKCTRYRGSWTSGKWYWETAKFDHLQIIGFTFGYYFIVDNIYSRHAKRISDIFGLGMVLDANSQGAASPDTEDSNSEVVLGVVLGVVMLAAVMVSVISYRRARSAERLADSLQEYMQSPDVRRSSSKMSMSTSFTGARQSSLSSLFSKDRPLNSPTNNPMVEMTSPGVDRGNKPFNIDSSV